MSSLSLLHIPISCFARASIPSTFTLTPWSLVLHSTFIASCLLLGWYLLPAAAAPPQRKHPLLPTLDQLPHVDSLSVVPVPSLSRLSQEDSISTHDPAQPAALHRATVTNTEVGSPEPPPPSLPPSEHSLCAMIDAFSQLSLSPRSSSAFARPRVKWKDKPKKTVRIAEELNEVQPVGNWIHPLLHQHSMFTGHVRWYSHLRVHYVDNWIEEPCGRIQMYFPRTKHAKVCGVFPDPSEEDDAGDCVMLD